MITFREWHQFNFVDNKLMDYFGDIYIKLFRKKSFKTEDRCFCQLMRVDDALKLFGNYPLMKINFHTEMRESSMEYKALCALICMEDDNNG